MQGHAICGCAPTIRERVKCSLNSICQPDYTPGRLHTNSRPTESSSWSLRPAATSDWGRSWAITSSRTPYRPHCQKRCRDSFVCCPIKRASATRVLCCRISPVLKEHLDNLELLAYRTGSSTRARPLNC